MPGQAGDGVETLARQGTCGDAQQQRCAGDARAIFDEVRRHWLAGEACGTELYAVAQRASERLGWQLYLDLCGHRLQQPVPAPAGSRPAMQQWRLEVHLRHPRLACGASYAGVLQEYAAVD